MLGPCVSDLDVLWRLEGRDRELREVRARRGGIPTGHAVAQSALAGARASASVLEERARAGLLARRNAEKEIEALAQQENKFQNQLTLVKENDEYTALLHEIAAVRKKRDELETFILERMNEEEAQGRQEASARASVQAAEARAGDECARLDAEDAALAARERALEEERAGLLAGLSPALRGRYDRILKAKGSAVAELLRDACGGCGETLPPQVAIEVRRQRGVVACPGCGRLVVHPAEDASLPADPP